MKKAKEKNLVKRFVWFEYIVMTLILLVSFVAVLFIVFKSMTDSELTSGAIESTLMSTGLSIIGIAISIWAGLNIIQVLEKDKLLELEKQAAAYKRERHILNKRDFLENVLAEKNELNSYIYKKLEQSSEQETEEISSELYFELNLIERIKEKDYEQAERHWELMKSFLEQFRLFEEGRIALGEKADDSLEELVNGLGELKKALKEG